MAKRDGGDFSPRKGATYIELVDKVERVLKLSEDDAIHYLKKVMRTTGGMNFEKAPVGKIIRDVNRILPLSKRNCKYKLDRTICPEGSKLCKFRH